MKRILTNMLSLLIAFVGLHLLREFFIKDGGSAWAVWGWVCISISMMIDRHNDNILP